MKKRQIKFRGFYNGEMRYPVHIHEYANIDFWSNEIFEGIPKEDISIMQFTGLHDKNRNPIYEGDILDADGEILIADDYNKFIYKIMYCEEHNGLNGYTQEDIEVIGNIHEHKHLLNEK